LAQLRALARPLDKIVAHAVPHPDRPPLVLGVKPHPAPPVARELLLPLFLRSVPFADDLDRDVERAAFPHLPVVEVSFCAAKFDENVRGEALARVTWVRLGRFAIQVTPVRKRFGNLNHGHARAIARRTAPHPAYPAGEPSVSMLATSIV